MDMTNAAKANTRSYSPPSLYGEEEDRFEQNNPSSHEYQSSLQPLPLQPLEIADPDSNHVRLSPSALDVSNTKKCHAIPQNNFHRWPSFALDSSTTGAFGRSSFMFADQVQSEGRNNECSRSSRRNPINVLKLPWHHPFRNHESNRNPYKTPRALFAALLLTTSLALLSAWDAQKHCISNETDALLALMGQESEDHPSQEEGENEEVQDELSEEEVMEVVENCREMFYSVMMPVGLVASLGSLVALGILRFHQNSFGKHKRLAVQSPACFYSFYLPLLLSSGFILATWTLGLASVMLRPRKNDSNNEYFSLAAVDSMGCIGKNANLYYMSWASEGIALLIFYQLFGAFVRQHLHPMISHNQAQPQPQPQSIHTNPSILSTTSSVFFPWQQKPAFGPSMISAKSSMENSLVQLPAYSPTKSIPSRSYHSSRIKWFQTFYQLRVRTGMWVAALLSSLVLLVSSTHIVHEVLLPAAQSVFDDDDYLADQGAKNDWWGAIVGNNHKVCVILAYHDSNLTREMCSRTFFSLLTGFVAVVFSFSAIILHMMTRRSAAADALYYEACGGVYHELALQMMATKHHHLPLRSELLLSFALSLWLGWNALMVSSVEGPAASVGNLYYSSWVCFLLCLRICLGCVEEFFNIKDEYPEHQGNPEQNVASLGPRGECEKYEQQATTVDSNTKDAAAKERERAKRLRRNFFLSAFSSVSAGSAIDAAMSQDYELKPAEIYMILAPTFAAILSIVLFLLCLSKVTYATVSKLWCGGVISFVIFQIWLVNLVLTMHSEDSWAVNGVGEIKMANLYYFGWASIITAGRQMTSYAKEALNLDAEDNMLLVWGGIGKVSFVILGSAGHIWNTIQLQCDDMVLIQNSAITYCSRTILAMFVAGTGILFAGVIVGTRLFLPERYFSTKTRIHCEAVTSIFLVLLFGVAVAMITGIGGPGQTVGDLFYSTWFGFWVSIVIFMSCYDQIKLEEIASEQSERNEPKEPGDAAFT